MVCAYPWPCSEALAVMRCESSGDPAAVGGANYGLFQVNAVHAWRVDYDLSRLLQPAVNVAIAYDIWSESGWQPWACRP